MEKKAFEWLLQKISFDYKGYSVEQLARPFLNVIVYRETASITLFITGLKKLFFLPNFRRLPAITTKIFFTFPEAMNRKDCLEIWKYVADQTDNKFQYRLSGLKKKFCFSYRKWQLAGKITAGINRLGFFEKFYLKAAIYNQLLMIDDAEKYINASVDKYVSFRCVMGIENLLTQYFKKRKIPTYNLQHGVTFIYDKNPVDALEYTNIISDYHLAWGNYTRDELIDYGFNVNQVFTAGYPRQQYTVPLKAPRSQNCLVFLSRKDFNEANLELLKMLAVFNRDRDQKVSFGFKLHPSLDEKEYLEMLEKNYSGVNFHLVSGKNTLQEILSSAAVDFSIVVNSTAYYECYMFGIPTLRFERDNFDMGHSLSNDSFSTEKEFAGLLEKLYKRFDEYFNRDRIYKELDYVLGLSKNEYGKILG